MNTLVVNASERGLVTKQDSASEGQLATVKPAAFPSFFSIVKGKLPLAVEIEPDAADKLWMWVFRAGDLFSVKNHAGIMNHKESQKVSEIAGAFYDCRWPTSFHEHSDRDFLQMGA